MSLLVILFALCVSSACAIRSAPIYDLEDAEQHFEDFIKRHDKQYADENEKQARFEIFKKNLEKINRSNEGQNITIFGPTFFTDLTLEEFLRSHTGYVSESSSDYDNVCTQVTDEELLSVNAPDAFDWRDKNAVTPVKNQLTCGSCYAFSTIGNIESQYAIKYGKQIDLAEQQIVDCDKSNQGCHGGTMTVAFSYIIGAGGAEGETDYPYRGDDTQQCTFDASLAVAKLSGCRMYSPSSQERVKEMLYTYGPISIGIRATGLSNLDGGLVTDDKCSEGEIDHAVLLVGYGTYSNGLPVWIVKNSWGTSWGDQGFFMMERGEDKQSCGMMNELMSSAVL